MENSYNGLKDFAKENWKDKNNSYLSYVVDNYGYSEQCFICKYNGYYYSGSVDNQQIFGRFKTLNNLFADLCEYGNEEPYEFDIMDGEVDEFENMLSEYEDLA